MEMDMVYLDNLPETANVVLNILWAENRRMTVAELTWRTNQVCHTRWEKRDIKAFANYLVHSDYAERRYHRFQVYYSALGMDV